MKDIQGGSAYPFDLNALPAGWTVAPVRNWFSEIQSGFACGVHNRDGRGVPHIRPMNVDASGAIQLDDVRYVPADVSDRRLRSGDVVFNNTNSPALVGKTAFYGRPEEVAFSNHMTRLSGPVNCDPRFIAHQLHYLWMRGYFRARCVNHVNQASVSSSTLANTVPLIAPDYEMQRQIVAELDTHFSRIDAVLLMLKRAKANVKRARASVLQAAVEGRLVPTEAELAKAEDRDYEPASVLLERILAERKEAWAQSGARGKYKEPAAPNTDDLPPLPKGWTWATVDQLADGARGLRDGPFGSNLKTAHYTSAGPRVVRLQNIGDGEFRDERAHISNSHFERLRKHEVVEGDLVIASLGERLPRACLIPGSLGSAIVKADCICFPPSKRVSAAYLKVALNSPPVRERTTIKIHGVGRPRLGLSGVRQIDLPLPPFAEQERIVGEVDRRLSVLDALDATLDANLARCAQLRQAILKRAFEGRLVAPETQRLDASDGRTAAEAG